MVRPVKGYRNQNGAHGRDNLNVMYLNERPSVVEELYDAAIAPERWTSALDSLARHCGASGALLLRHDDVEDGLPSCSRFSATARAIRERVAPSSILQTAERRRLIGSFVEGRIALPTDAGDRDAAMLVTQVPCGPGELITVMLGRILGEAYGGRFGDGLAAVHPDLSRAIRLSARVGLSRGIGLLEGLGALDCGAALVDSRGQIVQTNALADDLIAGSMRIEYGRLTVGDARSQARLDGQIHNAVDRQDGNDGDFGDFVVLRPAARGQQPLILQVSPIRSRIDAFGSIRAIIVFNDLSRMKGARSDVLAAVLDLRPSEAKVASRLAGGETIFEIAKALGLTTETVRSYVKNILTKARVRKQTAFVAIAAQVRTPHID